MARAGYKDVYKITGYLMGGKPIYGYVEEKDPDYVAPLSNNGSADIDFGNSTGSVAKNDYIQGAGNSTGSVAKNDYIQGADNLTENERETIRKRYLDAEYTPEQDLSQFEALLGKLEGSKMKQADQANRARRGDIYSQGIAQMMRNF